LALEKLYEIGKASSIGVSNWGIGHIEEMKEYAKIWPPHVNQIEVCTRTLSPITPGTDIDVSFTLGASNEK